MTSYVRGNTVSFSATPKDKDGNPVTPASANLYLEYITVAGSRTTVTIALTPASTLTYAWDSSVAREGLVNWSIKAVGSVKIAIDGSFMLTANESNPTS